MPEEAPRLPKRGSNRPRGSVIGRYVILEPLGKGGMGAVYSAYDTQLDRRVALKLLRAAQGNEPEEWRARLLREAQAMARLSHPNVVTVFDVGVDTDRQVFLSMEMVEKGTLTDWLLAQKRSWREIVEVCCEAGEGLAAAHEAGIVHRDFKLENVLMGADGRPRVTDFGVASVAIDGWSEADTPRDSASAKASLSGLEWQSASSLSVPLTMTGAMLGTPGFMAPEQYDVTSDLDARADIFAFCATLYRAVYGERAFAGVSLHEIATATFKGEVRPAPKGSDVPMWLRRVLLQGLSVDPAARHASIRALLTTLRTNLTEPVRRRRRCTIGAVTAGVCALGALAWARHDASLRAQCARGSELIASTWNPALEKRVRDALQRTEGRYAAEVADRVAERLSSYSRTWAATHRTIAESTLLRGEQSAVDMGRRMQCLERGRQQLEALADVLAQSDASTVQHAVDAAYRLPAPGRCATSDLVAAPALPTSPELRARFLAVDRAVARASALGNAGQDQQVEALVERTLPEVRAISHRVAEAELLTLLGRAKMQLGNYAQGLASYQDALFAAERASNDSLAARSASQIAFALSGYLERPQEAEGWIHLAQAIAERAGQDEAVEQAVISSRIVVTAMLGHPEKVLDLHDRDIAISQKLYGEADPRLSTAIMNRAVTLNRIGQNDRAVADAQRAIDLLAAATGPSNPHLDLSYITLGNPLIALGRLSEARAALEHALELQAGRPPGTLTVCIFLNLAAIAETSRDLDGTIRTATRGLEIANAIGDDQVFKWSLMVMRARALGQKGDLKAQAEGCLQALAAQKAHDALTAARLYVPDTFKCLGEVELAMHRPDAAIAYFEQSVALERRPDPSDLPLARFALARALRGAGRDPARARTLAESAKEALSQIVGDHRDVAEIEQWLKEGDARVAVRTPGAR